MGSGEKKQKGKGNRKARTVVKPGERKTIKRVPGKIPKGETSEPTRD